MHIYTDSDAAEQMLISTYEGSDDTRTIAARSAPLKHRSHSTPKSARTITASCCAARQIKQPAINQQVLPSTVFRRRLVTTAQQRLSPLAR